MNETRRTTFLNSALASGLLTSDQIEEAQASLREVSGLPASTAVASDRLAAKLVELGRLNRWQAEQLKVGRSRFTLGPYRILDSIGQGGMGQVFKAEHTLMGRIVAIKVLPRYKSTPEAIESFQREVRAQAQLDHPNLVRAYDAGRDSSVYFFVTEYVPGTDLRKLVRSRGKLTMAEAATIISQAAMGLGHAHSRGLIHRDIKPGNLLVTPEGHTKVSDLGLAGFFGSNVDDDPRAGKVVGTADYLSPEQVLTPREVTPASDIYSLGCTLYYAVTGKVPFPGGTTREKTRRHCRDAPLTPRRFNADLDDDFLDVLAAMMEKEPARRIGSTVEAVERLSPWAKEAIATSLSELGIRLDQPPPRPQVASSAIAETPSLLFDPAVETDDTGSSRDRPQSSSTRIEAPRPIASPTRAHFVVTAAIGAVMLLGAAALLVGVALVALQ